MRLINRIPRASVFPIASSDALPVLNSAPEGVTRPQNPPADTSYEPGAMEDHSPVVANDSRNAQIDVRFCFDGFCIDPVNRQLTSGNRTIPLTPLAFTAILFLARNNGRVIPKAELLAAIWPDTSVYEANLAVMISTVRKALGDDGHSQKYIKTMSKIGYRFSADVHTVNTGPVARVLPQEHRFNARLPWVAPLGLALIIILIGWIYRFERFGRSRPAVVAPIVITAHDQMRGPSRKLLSDAPHPEGHNANEAELRGQARALYLKGRYSWSRGTDEGLKQSIVYFNESIAEDPRNALAYAGLADAYASLGTWSVQPSAGAYKKAREAAHRAVQLDDSLSVAHSSLGLLAMYQDWNWQVAGAEFRRALELDPSDALAHQRYGMYLAAMGMFDDSLEQMRMTRDLDPVSPYMAVTVGKVLYYSRRYSEAAAEYKKVIELDPHFSSGHYYLGLVYFKLGELSTADSELKQADTLANGREPLTTGMHVAVLARLGRASEAQKDLAKLLERSKNEYVSPLSLAFAYMGVGDNGKALDWIEKMFHDHIVTAVFLGIDPIFDPLRADVRFVKLVQQLDGSKPPATEVSRLLP